MKHLSSSAVQSLHRQLVEMRARLLEEIRIAHADIESVHESLEGESRGGSDASELSRLEALRRSEIAIDESKLSAIDEAERRMNEGNYGVCMACGKAIAPDRLLALPTAVRCTECEQAPMSQRG